MAEHYIGSVEVTSSTLVISSTSQRTSLCSKYPLNRVGIFRLLRRCSFFVKRHARLTCSNAFALTTVRYRYHLFTRVPSALLHLYCSALQRRNKLRLFRFFFVQKNQSPASLFLLFRKRSHSSRLFACKRAHNAFVSLPTFYECAFGTSCIYYESKS